MREIAALNSEKNAFTLTKVIDDRWHFDLCPFLGVRAALGGPLDAAERLVRHHGVLIFLS
jgi:hypothetical protein